MFQAFKRWLGERMFAWRRQLRPPRELAGTEEPAFWFLNGFPGIHAREGLALTIQAGEWDTPRNAFAMALLASCSLAGKPVRCAGYIPGVSLIVTASFRFDAELIPRISRQWDEAQPKLLSWIESSHAFPCITMQLSDSVVTLALDEFVPKESEAMSIHIVRAWGPASRQPVARCHQQSSIGDRFPAAQFRSCVTQSL